MALGVWLVVSLSACTRRSVQGTSQGPVHVRAATPPSDEKELMLRYWAVLSEDGRELCIRALFPPRTPGKWSVDPVAQAYVGRPMLRERSLDDGPTCLAASDGEEREYSHQLVHDGALQKGCVERGCSFEYRFELARAAREIARRTVAVAYEGVVVAPASTWLLRPREPPPGARYRFSVTTPPGVSFVTGTSRASEEGTFEAALPRGYFAPYSAFGPLRARRFDIGGAEIEVALLGRDSLAGERFYVDWVIESAQAVSGYLGKFPARRALVLLRPEPFFGSQLGRGGASLLLGMDPARPPKETSRDWVAVHEMFHIAFVGTPRRHRWASEGLATYAESVARTRANMIEARDLWSLFVERFPLGVPGEQDRGLDHTGTWASTYWGGAVFWFLADLATLERTRGEMGLGEVLAGLVDRGANTEVFWPLPRVFDVADEIVGAPVFSGLYAGHGLSRGTIDLDELWSFLGVERGKAGVFLDDAALGSPFRRAIEAGVNRVSRDGFNGPVP